MASAPFLLCFAAAAFPCLLLRGDEPAAPRDSSAAEQLGWHLATKAYTFRDITLLETIEISRSLGVADFEMNPGQRLSKENPVKTDQTLAPELREQIKSAFQKAAVRPVNFGVIKLTHDEAADRKIFNLARDLGIRTIVSEPDADAFDLLDKLCEEYGIDVAIHNHPQPSHYWNPETVLAAIKGHSSRIGACADVGHWTRSGLDASDCLRQLEGHIKTLHFKDVNDDKKDVPWGSGKTNVRAMLDELHRQGFKGVFSMEYESAAGDALLDALRQSIVYFDTEARRIAR